MEGYLKNNIGFRHFTASKYADFYRAKAFLLGEVLNSPKYEFSAQARETLLQYFSYSTVWLMECEKDYIRYDASKNLADITQSCATSFTTMVNTVMDVMSDNPQDFDSKFVSVWKELAESQQPNFNIMLISRSAEDREEAFAYMVDFLVGFMNHALYTLHELDSLLTSDQLPFVHVDRVDVTMMMQSGEFCSPCSRIETYVRHGLLETNTLGEIKPQLDPSFVSSNSVRQASFRSIRSNLSALNFFD